MPGSNSALVVQELQIGGTSNDDVLEMTASDELSLAADFAPATFEDWRKLVDGVLKGAPFEKLVSKTYDGLTIEVGGSDG